MPRSAFGLPVVGLSLMALLSLAMLASPELVSGDLAVGGDGTLSIDVNTGEQQYRPPPTQTTTELPPIDATEQGWPSSEASLDLDGVKVVLGEGEDVSLENDSPAKLIVRALQRLPVDEQRRIGFLALMQQLHPAADGSYSTNDEASLVKLWEARQAELKAAMEEMTEIASMLTGLIETLQSPLPEGEEAILNTLEALEDHLTDIDMARDFHDSLGGWPHLAHLLAQHRRHAEVSAAAALVVGTAVKNEREFQSWLLDAIYDDGSTAFHSLVEMLSAESSDAVQRRALYALASGLSHNPAVKAAFVHLGGLNELAVLASMTPATPTAAAWTLKTKVATVVSDWLYESDEVLSEAALAKLAPDDAAALRQANQQLRSPDWCQATATALDPDAPTRTHDKALLAFSRQAKHCQGASNLKAKLDEVVRWYTPGGPRREGMDATWAEELAELAALCRKRLD